MNRITQRCIFILVLIVLFINVPYFTYTYAQDASESATGCFILNQNNLPNGTVLPPGCESSGGNGSVVWPYPVKTPSQYMRVDQGWDLEYPTMGNPVFAVVSGTINYNHGVDPCDGGSGFGLTYPLEVLDKPITVNGRTYTQIYYGHTDGNPSLNGKHVNAGDVIAKTYDCVNFGGVWIPWLEIGFWNPAIGPVGQTITPCSIDTTGSTVTTQAGCDMKQWLNANTK